MTQRSVKPIQFLTCVLLILAACELDWAQKPEFVVQVGHFDAIDSVAFSLDGKTLASGSWDKTIKLWDVASGTELRTLNGHSDRVWSVAFSSDGRTLASGSADKTIKLWNVASGTELYSLEAHSGDVKSVEFSPDGRILASSSWDKTIRLWDVAAGTELRTLTGHSHSVGAIAFSPDGKRLAGCTDKTINLWDVASGTELYSFKGHSGDVLSVAYSPDGKLLASSGLDETIKLWDVASATELRERKGNFGDVQSVTFSRDGKTLAFDSYETIKMWNFVDGGELRELKGHFGTVQSVAFSSDGKTLASGSWDKTIRLWDVANATELHELRGHSGWVNSAAFSSDGKSVASGSWDGTIRVWDTASGIGLQTFKGDSEGVMSVAFSPDGRMAASGNWDKTIVLWDLARGTKVHKLEGHSYPVMSLAFSPEGKVLASGSWDGTIRLWDVASGTEFRRIRAYGVVSVAFSPDGTLASDGGNGIVKLWDVHSGTELRSFVAQPDHRGTTVTTSDVSSVVFSPDGKTLASGSYDNTVKLWDVTSGSQLHALKGHHKAVTALAFSPDGKTLASGSGDETIKLWDVVSGSESRTLNGHSRNKVLSVAFSMNSKYLVSGSADINLKVWDVISGEELAGLITIDEKDWAVVTPDGLFDGSAAAWSKILWRFNNRTFDHAPVEAFFNEYYRPGLLAEIFAGKQPKAASDISQKDRRQPKVKLGLANAESNRIVTDSARKAMVNIEVSELTADKDHKAGSGAQDVRLFRNGSLVKLWSGDLFELNEKDSCKLQPQATSQNPRRSVCTATVPLVAGPNNFTAYAFNSDNIKSEDATLIVTGADSLRRKGRLHIVAVGVSKYANKAYNLKYTTDDAASLSSQLKLQQERLGRFETVNIKTLLNEEATKANTLAELKRLSTAVQPEDAVVVYFSGHGKADGDHFYLVPHDLGYSGSRDQLSPEGLQQVLKHSISDVELEEAFRNIDAGQMFMIIDACNSGQALENKDEPRRGPMNTRGLVQLAYEKGMYILTASQNVEEAFVSEKLRHSYLTYALVEEGLKTKLADADDDSQVTLREWFDYGVARVPKLREATLQSKSLDQVDPIMKAARGPRSQTPRVFYRREPDVQPLVVAKTPITRR